MDRKEIIDGLKMTMELCVFDPSTGEEIEPHLLNDMNRATYDACRGALEILGRLDTDTDTISRQAAIDALYSQRDKSGNIWVRTAITDCVENINELPPARTEQHIDADGTLWITVTDIEQVKRVIVDEDKSKFCKQFYEDAKPEQRTDLLKAEIKRMKRSFTICINRDYYTGYMSALSAVEGYIAQSEGDAE